MERNQLINGLWNIIEISNERDGYYSSKHRSCIDKVNSISYELQEKKNEKIEDLDEADYALLATWILTIAASIYFMTIDHWIWAAILFVPTFFVFRLITFIIVFPIARKLLKKKQENYLQSDAYKQSIIEIEKKLASERDVLYESQKVLNEIEGRLNNAYSAATFLPNNYKHINAVGNIYRYLQDNRVDSIKEAINLYETEVYRNEVKQQQEHIIYQQEMSQQQQYEHQQQLKEIQKEIKEKNRHLSDLEQSNKRIQSDLDDLKWR